MEKLPQIDTKNTPTENRSFFKKIAQKAMATGQKTETTEKKYYETYAEFTADEITSFRNELLSVDSDEAKKIVDSRIAILEEKADKPAVISRLPQDQHIHRGYISRDTVVSFDGTIGGQYKLRNTEYLYDAVEYLRGNKDRINSHIRLFEHLAGFLNSYFGIPDTSKDRWEALNAKTNFSSAKDDDEYWDIINNIDISIFKGECIAQCSERSAMAQNVMALLGYETYYAIGDVSVDGKNEGHAYNIVTTPRGAKSIVDYSVLSSLEYGGLSWDMPTMVNIEDYDAFAAGGRLEASTHRHIIQEDGTVIHKPARALEYGMLAPGFFNNAPNTSVQNPVE